MSIAQNPASCCPRLRVLWAIIVFCFFPAHPALLAFAQSDDLQEADRLNQEVNQLSRRLKYDEALPLAQRALAIYEKLLGPDDPAVAGALSTLADLYKQKEDFSKAEPLYLRALAIYEKTSGPDHADLKYGLSGLAEHLAYLYEGKGDYGKAESLLQHALAILEKAQDSRPDDVTSVLFTLALLYETKGDYGKAESLLQRSLAIYERVHTHPRNEAYVLSRLAWLYEEMGHYSVGAYSKAEPLLQRALAITEEAFGPDSPAVVSALDSLASVYERLGDYGRAESLLQRALAITEKVFTEKAFGPGHGNLFQALDNLARHLADFYEQRGDSSKAESPLQHILAICEKADGPDSAFLTIVLQRLADLYELKGDYGKAEPLLERALAITEKLGGNSTAMVIAFDPLAHLYQLKGDYGKAESLLQRLLTIIEKASGPDSSALGEPLSALAELYERKGDYDKAESLLERALAITEKSLGPDGPVVALALQKLAGLYERKGDYGKAEPLYQRALVITEKTTGLDSFSVEILLKKLAQLYEKMGDYSGAVAVLARTIAITEAKIPLHLAAGSERQKSAILNSWSISDETNQVCSLHLLAAPDNPAALRLALTTLLRRKGRALDATADSISALRRHLTPELQALLDQLTSTRSRLAALILDGPGRKTPQQHRAEVQALEEQAERLEDQISRQSAEYRAQSQPVTIEAVQAAIPADAALAEFVSYEVWNAKTQDFTAHVFAAGERRYGAYVLTDKGEAKAVDLGDANTIDEAVRGLRAVLRREGNKPLSDVERELKPKARALDELVMRPVRQLLGEQRRLLIAPDGALSLIPYAALVDENSDFLVQHYSISYLTSGRDLLRLQVKIPSKQGAAVIADPDFNAAPLTQPAVADTRIAQRVNAGKDRIAERKEAAPGPKIGGLEFRPLTRLPGTAEEARAVQKSLPGARVLTGNAASRAAVKRLSGPAILHIATHGFFLEDQTAAPDTRLLVRQDDKDLQKAAAPAIPVHNPLLRSGLFFAGANTRGMGSGDDGILTALEASGLDLYGTKLVVLSACDTGLGDVKIGDGVYGLRRALVLAGSETQVMSLWSVSDKGTSELMIDYYKRLKAGEGRSEALKNAQLQMLANPKRSHPYYWAAFIQSGEWANLDGKR